MTVILVIMVASFLLRLKSWVGVGMSDQVNSVNSALEQLV
jgi:hypothetical protein